MSSREFCPVRGSANRVDMTRAYPFDCGLAVVSSAGIQRETHPKVGGLDLKRPRLGTPPKRICNLGWIEIFYICYLFFPCGLSNYEASPANICVCFVCGCLCKYIYIYVFSVPQIWTKTIAERCLSDLRHLSA